MTDSGCLGRKDVVQLGHDYLKHLTTLDTGAIVIVAAFLDRFDQPHGVWAMVSALGLLLVSVVSIVWFHLVFVILVPQDGSIEIELSDRANSWYIACFATGLGGFVLGLVFLVVFILYNVL